ncbi:ATP-binding protein [Salibacterium halotolerans]|uniref:histidine kinase n=1 Tax=Salibacterium halotolerans TaxID=1884432 RepID=A0A1I5RN60_9BACI|nr:sensor histidine kinase [Salibacterium halotolerans]SFP59975.1 two-component system, CitB family, sensor histidine kinase CitS [Salibacterium halotolerans]
MIQKLLRVSLKTKITGMVVGLIVTLIVLLLSIFTYFETNQIFSNKKTISLQTAKTISYIPAVSEALQEEDNDSAASLQALTEKFSIQNDADFIIIQNRSGIILTHPSTERVREYQEFDDGYRAAVFGGYYNIVSKEFLGKSVMGKAPVLSEDGEVLGVVSVGYLIDNIYKEIFDWVKNILYIALAVVLVGVCASIFLARHIRNETLGLEPREIAALYRDRNSVLSSINEGVIATDESGRITMINHSAKTLLNLSHDIVNRPIQENIPEVNVTNTIKKSKSQLNEELYINNKVIILNLTPIIEEEKLVGAVATFKDKTEIKEMINTLSEVKKYSEDLRAQTHEFANKMYVISGLLQLGSYEEALEMVQKEAIDIKNSNSLIFELIKDTKVQAILLGKMSKASEKKINFNVDENSHIEELPSHIEVYHVATIIGNLIDNAFEEVINQTERRVTFSTLDIGQDIIFEITDNGSGMEKFTLTQAAKAGYSTKNPEKERGFGLFNVNEVIDELNGSIEITSNNSGTTFSVFIPKEPRGK